MPKYIWKYPIDTTDHQRINMPIGAEPIYVATQKGFPCIWCIVEKDHRLVPARITVRGTGHLLNESDGRYVGSYQLMDGDQVYHVFAEIDMSNHTYPTTPESIGADPRTVAAVEAFGYNPETGEQTTRRRVTIEWISTDERMPDDDDPVMVAYKFRERLVTVVAWRGGGEWLFGNPPEPLYLPVTYWMPMSPHPDTVTTQTEEGAR